MTACMIAALMVLACIARTHAISGGICTPTTGRSTSPPLYAEDGIFYVQTAADIDRLIADCTTLDGSLAIVCADQSISSLEVFNSVEEITGYLRIEGCHNLTDLHGFRNLQSIKGNVLYNIPDQQQGFALLIRNNDGLTSLRGLDRLQKVSGPGRLGLGRVGVMLNDNLCYADKVNWQRVVGQSLYWRVLDIVAPATAICATASCHSSCACGTCFGPEEADCQTRCEADDTRSRTIILAVLLFCLFFGILVITLWMCVTNRCGCRLRWKSSIYQLGVLSDSGRRLSEGPKSATRDPFAGQENLIRRAHASINQPSSAIGRRNSRRVVPA
eukprot:m.47911 g.47911  ORF g.47911 m.47911 type:complete len:329 (-) comp12359_c0_seq1:178-1164(-)